MARRNSSGDLAGLIIAVTLFLPIILIVYLFKGIIYLINLALNEKAKRKEKKIYEDILNTNIQEQLAKIDTLDGFQFEKYIGQLLKKIGFKNVIVTKGSGDFGADIIAEKDNDKYAFQCKRFTSTIGPKPIGEVLRGMNKYKCNKGIVITNSYFTNQAIQEAKVSNVELWDRDKLSTLLEKNQDILPTFLENKEIVTEKVHIENSKKGKELKMQTDTNSKLTSTNCFELTAGYYEVDEDIDEGKYMVEVVSGNGVLMVQDRNNYYKVSECIALDVPYFINKYNNLKLVSGDIMQIKNAVTLRFVKIN